MMTSNRSRRNPEGSSIWHLVIADYFAAKSLVFFLALTMIASMQMGVLKVLGNTKPDQKPPEKVDLVLGGGGKLFVVAGDKQSPLEESKLAEVTRGKAVIFHAAQVVKNPAYGSEYVKYLGLMGEAKSISPGKALAIE